MFLSESSALILLGKHIYVYPFRDLNRKKIMYFCRMNFVFYKYQGTGNDFIVIDNRTDFFPKEDPFFIEKLCDRKWGIGADGLLLLETHTTLDFRMVYFNADGKQSSMCGNGGRCLTHFAKYLNIIKDKTAFEAIDGIHTATIQENEVCLKMNDVRAIEVKNDFVFLDTGSPHHVCLCNEIENINVQKVGAQLRNQLYGSTGANINFVEQIDDNHFSVRTYERGVEAETLSCGTGATAVALAMYAIEKTSSQEIKVTTQGGLLKVTFEKRLNSYTNIYLIGPVSQVFKGEWSC